MPELPEVETVARGLQPLAGKRLLELEIFDPRVWFECELPPVALSGRRLRTVARRGKYLLLRFEGGLSLVQHLRMTGKMLATGHGAIPAAVMGAIGSGKGKALQLRCRFRFDSADLVFFDTRRFGTLTLVGDEEAFFRAKGIAPDPIADPGRAETEFLTRIRSSRKPAKAALLDQGIAAGVGNIYADEALFAAGIHPLLPALRIREPRRLWEKIRKLLLRSIRSGGSTINDYVNAEGEKGDFARLLRVYGREGEPCQECGTTIRRLVVAGRSTHFCPLCQPARLARRRSAVSD